MTNHEYVLLNLLTLGLMCFNGAVFAAEPSPEHLGKERRQKRQTSRAELPLAFTFGMGMVSSTSPMARTPINCGETTYFECHHVCPDEEDCYEQFNHSHSWPGVLSIQLEFFAKPKTSLSLGWSTAADAANLIHLSARQGFGNTPHSVFFTEGGLTYGRAKNFGWFGLPPGRKIVGFGPRLVVGYKRQFRNRLVFEVGAGLSTSVYTKWTRSDWKGEHHQERVVVEHPMLLVPELNIRLGWRLNRPKTRNEFDNNVD